MNEQQKKLLSSLKEIAPKNGLVYSEKQNFTEILCKPKILPIKSLTLQKLEDMEKQLNAEVQKQQQQ